MISFMCGKNLYMKGYTTKTILSKKKWKNENKKIIIFKNKYFHIKIIYYSKFSKVKNIIKYN